MPLPHTLLVQSPQIIGTPGCLFYSLGYSTIPLFILLFKFQPWLWELIQVGSWAFSTCPLFFIFVLDRSLFGSDECFGVFVRGGPEWLCLAATSPFILWGKLPGYPWALDCPSTTGRNFSLLGKNMGTGNRKQTADAGGNLEGKEEQHDKLGPGSGQGLLQQGSLSEETQSTKLLVFFLVTTGKGISEFAESQLEVPIKAFLTEVTLESRLWKYISNKNRKSAQVQDSHPPS